MKAEDNPFPYLTLVETSAPPATPAAGRVRIYRDSDDNVLYQVDETGAATPIGGGSAAKSVTVLGDGSGNVNVTADNTYRDLSTTWAQVSIAAAVGDKLLCNFDFEWYRSAASGNGTLCAQFSVGASIRDPWFAAVDGSGATRHEFYQIPLVTVASGDIVSGLVTVKIRVAGPTSNPQVTIFNEAGPTATIYKRRPTLNVVNLGAL